MKIGIISDTHGHAGRFKQAVDKFFSGADLIIHAGDVLYHGPRNKMLGDYNPAALADIINESEIPFVIAKGNCDSEVDQMVINTPIEAPFAHVNINGLRIVATHGHLVEDDEAKDDMAKHLKADIFISGHIHTTVLEKRGNTVFVNPGSPSLSKRADGRSTVAVMTDDAIKIYDIDTDEVLDELRLK
ncbi:MAG: phosphodiesterase [Selenomonadaceae bacterium]|nr:phosphodiesterase [Selenomonadaceae bacterium]MBP3723871.1 phosphodiesterase [Selenomonadaceae bacterium]